MLNEYPQITPIMMKYFRDGFQSRMYYGMVDYLNIRGSDKCQSSGLRPRVFGLKSPHRKEIFWFEITSDYVNKSSKPTQNIPSLLNHTN